MCILFLNLKFIYISALSNCVLFKSIFASNIVLLMLLGLPLQLTSAFISRLLHYVSKHIWEKLNAAHKFAVSLTFSDVACI